VAKTVEATRRHVEVSTSRGPLVAAAAIITVSTAVLAAGKIKFDPDLPRRHVEAVSKLTLGSYDHVAIELSGNPLDLQSDDLVFEKAAGQRTAALLANASGSTLCVVEVAGPFGKSLAAQGDAAMVAFATDWLADLYGADMRKAIRRTHATQ